MVFKGSTEQTMFYGAAPSVFENAKTLRNNMTQEEKILWGHLRKKAMQGYRFKAQLQGIYG